ncbi:MAG: DUF3866 family protein [Ilumatobacteraceae bacterium]
MPTFRTLRVAELISERPGLQRVRLDDGSRAYAVTALVGEISVGDEVVVNTTAVDLDLGTGGWHVVHWNLARSELHIPGPGHIMKLRYTSTQIDTGAAEEDIDGLTPGIPHLGGTPVVTGSLHSQLGVVAAVVGHLRPGTRVSYVMTDGGALPMALSDLVASLRESALLTGTVTAGQAFGGEHEAVSVASALQIATELQQAELIMCAMGPGVVGTGTALGTTALEVASVLSFAHHLGARPIAVVRASEADARDRHRGISHHTTTALAMTDVPVDVPVPPELVSTARDRLVTHRVIEVPPPDVEAVLGAAQLTVTTMGRGPADDPLSFRTVAAAATHAVNSIP